MSDWMDKSRKHRRRRFEKSYISARAPLRCCCYFLLLLVSLCCYEYAPRASASLPKANHCQSSTVTTRTSSSLWNSRLSRKEYSNPGDDPFATTKKRQRSLLMCGSMDDWIEKQQQHKQVKHRQQCRLASSKTATYNPYMIEEKKDSGGVMKDENDAKEEDKLETAKESDDSPNGNKQLPQKKESRVKTLWPPWPFNMLHKSSDGTPGRKGPAVRFGSFLWSFMGQEARVSFKEMQDIGSRLWFHLPPMTPPLIFWTMIPQSKEQVLFNVETGLEEIVKKTTIPLFSNPLARTLALGGFSLGVFSWAHSELTRLRKLTPLPLNRAYRDIHRAILPHVLPEEVPEPFLVEDDDDEVVVVQEVLMNDGEHPGEEASPASSEDTTSDSTSSSNQQQSQSSISKKLASSVPPRLQRHFKQFGSSQQQEGKPSKPKRQSWKFAWKKMDRMRSVRRAESQKVKRMAIYDELVALQAIKRKARQEQQKKGKPYSKRNKNGADELPLGYALVTGASRGIGRAIAVELARWEIPLILVARDLPRLTSLAYDLEACYGVKCCVLQADLSHPNAAQQIHEATKQAGLMVDVLVNNAGISSAGLSVDMPLEDVNRMVRVNGLAVAELAHLYGKDMKERRRGRILMVSSVVGAVAAGPTVALYAATKAFEKVLGLSMAKELEPYGVGITVLMPGAVRDTDFRPSSGTREALCWRLPGYPKSPTVVAKQGIRALLRGDVEVTPGWQNRAFLKVFRPAMPQRLHNILVEMAWTPPGVPPFMKIWKTPDKRQRERQKQLEGRNNDNVRNGETRTRRTVSPQEWRPLSNTFLPPPLLLAVPGEKKEAAPPPQPRPEKHVDPIPLNRSTLVGPDLTKEAGPTISEPQSDTSTSSPEETSDIASSSNIDIDEEQHGQETQKQLLQPDASAVPGYGSAQSIVEESSPGSTNDTASENRQQQQALQESKQQQEMLQLKEQVLRLKEQVQEEREKELDRRQRELEDEKRDMEERGHQEASPEKTERWHSLGWRKRVAKPSEANSQKTTEHPEKLQVVQPSSPPQKKEIKNTLMDESLDHPLFAR